LELRCYAESTWVSVYGKGRKYRKASNLQSWRIFRYANGGNLAKERMQIGSPFLRLYDERKDIYTIEFLLPSLPKGGKLPLPLDHSVRVAKRSPFCAYVYSVQDRSSSPISPKSMKAQGESLLEKHKLTSKADMGYYFYALYGNIGSIPGRRINEIWFTKRHYVDPSWRFGEEESNGVESGAGDVSYVGDNESHRFTPM